MTARYIGPGVEQSPAQAFGEPAHTVLLPAPAGPSIVTTRRMRFACLRLVRSTPGGEERQGLPAGDAGVQLVPVRDLGLAEPPAEVDLAAVHDAVEVAKAVGALQLDAQAGQFVDVRRELRLLGLEFGLALREFLGVGSLDGRRARSGRPRAVASAR